MSNRKAKNHVEDTGERAGTSANPAHARAWELARRQGVKPIKSIKELQGDFWPEDESVDEFLEWLRTIRRENGTRSIYE
jgi:hypothetical protein